MGASQSFNLFIKLNRKMRIKIEKTKWLLWSYYLFAGFNAMDSLLVLVTLLAANAFHMVPSPWLAVAISVVGAGIYLVTIELTMGAIALPTFKDIAAGRAKSAARAYAGMVVHISLLASISFGISYAGRAYMVETIIPNPVTVDVSEQVAGMKATSAAQVADLRQQIAVATRAKAAAIAGAGTPAIIKMAENGNEWAATKLKAAKTKAAEKFDAHITGLQQAMASAITAANADASQRETTAAAANAAALNSTLSARSSLSNFQLYGSIVSLLMMFWCAALYAAMDAADGSFDGTVGGSRRKQQKSQATAPFDVDATLRPGNTSAGVTTRTVTGHHMAFSKNTETPVKPVITADAVVFHGDPAAEVDGMKVYEDNNGNTTAIVKNGAPMDRTKLKQYLNTYARRATTSVGTKAREDNAGKAYMFAKALHDIYGEEMPQARAV
jgi:hypothetical protein